MRAQNCAQSVVVNPLGDFKTVGGAAAVLLAVEAGLFFSMEPVCSVSSRQEKLYVECLARLGLNGQVWSPGSFLPQLDLAGRMRWFDSFIVGRALQMLERNPLLTLGCNLSAQSAVVDNCWEEVFCHLACNKSLANRLVLEITETAPLDPDAGYEFVKRVKHLGCRVAVDDFGLAYGVWTSLLIGNPDIIKIDASFLAGARDSRQGRRRLAGMVRFAGDLAEDVVVEGVENTMDLELVQQSGAAWAQGFLFGPSVCSANRIDTRCTVI